MIVNKISMSGLSFKSSGSDKSKLYKNPVSVDPSQKSIIVKSSIGAAVTGIAASLLASRAAKGRQFTMLVGLSFAALFLGLSLPSAIYKKVFNKYV